MAIDDNTSYELTGYQVKDLAQKIRAKADSSSLASVATSGLYSDLTGAPTIPTVYNGELTITQNGTNVGTFTANASSNTTIALTDTTYSAFTGATSQDAGASGLVPAPSAGDGNKVLSGAGTWVAVSSGGSYSAGNGINIDSNNAISIDTAVVAEVSDIPTNTSDLTNDGSDGTSTYVEADDLATVATSGSYSDLSGTPNLATVATSGSYTDLTNTPSIPAAQVNSDWNANSGVAEILNKPNLATVATSGSYSDLTNKPTIPAAQVNSDWNANSGVAEILNKPSLATVATSGAYSDLTGTPTIPTVNDATLTITQNGVSAGTFTANASSDTTIALTDTTYSTMTGASSGTAGTSGLVPAPAAGDENKVLSGAGTWAAVTSDKIDWSTICYSNSHTETNGAFRIINKSTTRTINVGDNEFSISISSQVPTGFVPIGIVGMDLSGPGYSRIIITRNYISGDTISCCFYQTYNSSQSIAIAWKILCIKSAN